MPLLADFGEACIGDKEHEGLIQPDLYRAPEVVLGMKWTPKVDIWNVGVLVCNLMDLYWGVMLTFLKDMGSIRRSSHV